MINPHDIPAMAARYQHGKLSTAQIVGLEQLVPRDINEAVERLQRLANHLTGKRGHRKFDFREIVYFIDPETAYLDPERALGCGTAGCALGELPYCFPETFELALFMNAPWVIAKPIGRRGVATTILAGNWFGLDDYEVGHLFVPAQQYPRMFGGRCLSENATPNDVAQQIHDFLGHRLGAGPGVATQSPQDSDMVITT